MSKLIEALKAGATEEELDTIIVDEREKADRFVSRFGNWLGKRGVPQTEEEFDNVADLVERTAPSYSAALGGIRELGRRWSAQASRRRAQKLKDNLQN